MRIVWTKEEKRALRDCMIDICYVTPMMSNKGLFKAAQEEVIPYERRTKVTDQRVFNYKALINEARAAAEKHRQAVSKPKPAPTPPPVIAPEPVKKLDTLGEVFELFIDALADRIMDKMIAAKQQVEQREEPQPSVIVEKGWLDELEKLTIRKKQVKKCPTVLVVGLNGCQMEVIKNYKPNLDFTFATAEQALSHYTFNKDHTILMTKFINHSVQAKYRKHPNLHYCNGGVSELKHMLQVIFHKEYA
jgi:hypothetical protein